MTRNIILTLTQYFRHSFGDGSINWYPKSLENTVQYINRIFMNNEVDKITYRGVFTNIFAGNNCCQ